MNFAKERADCAACKLGRKISERTTDDNVTSVTSPGTVFRPLADHLGTIRDLATHDNATDATTIVNHRIFDSYGILISESNSSFQIIFGFTGVYFDTVTSLNYHRNRWYDPATGRWISEDPIGFNGGDTNLNRYVGNNPVSRTDPSGLSWLGDYWHYLTNPWDMDTDLEIGFYCAAGTAAVAGAAAGGILIGGAIGGGTAAGGAAAGGGAVAGTGAGAGVGGGAVVGGAVIGEGGAAAGVTGAVGVGVSPPAGVFVHGINLAVQARRIRALLQLLKQSQPLLTECGQTARALQAARDIQRLEQAVIWLERVGL